MLASLVAIAERGPGGVSRVTFCHGLYTGDVSGKTILAVISDLMFQSLLQKQARALGYEIAAADGPEAVRYGLDRSPALLVIDLHVASLDWRQVVEAAKEGGVPVLAFGRHTEAQLLRSAREAGCSRVVARSTFVDELPRLIEELAGAGRPPMRGGSADRGYDCA